MRALQVFWCILPSGRVAWRLTPSAVCRPLPRQPRCPPPLPALARSEGGESRPEFSLHDGRCVWESAGLNLTVKVFVYSARGIILRVTLTPCWLRPLSPSLPPVKNRPTLRSSVRMRKWQQCWGWCYFSFIASLTEDWSVSEASLIVCFVSEFWWVTCVSGAAAYNWWRHRSKSLRAKLAAHPSLYRNYEATWARCTIRISYFSSTLLLW